MCRVFHFRGQTVGKSSQIWPWIETSRNWKFTDFSSKQLWFLRFKLAMLDTYKFSYLYSDDPVSRNYELSVLAEFQAISKYDVITHVKHWLTMKLTLYWLIALLFVDVNYQFASKDHFVNTFQLALNKIQDAGQTKSNDPKCPFPQGLGYICENLVQPTRQERASPQSPWA